MLRVLPRTMTLIRAHSFVAGRANSALVVVVAAPPLPLLPLRRRVSTTATRLLPFRAAAARRLINVSASAGQSSASSSSAAGVAAAAAVTVAAAAAATPTAAAASPRAAVGGGPPPPRPGALPFDTPLAIALAGAAFEAYNSPAAAAGAGEAKAAADGEGSSAPPPPLPTPAAFDFVDADGTRTTYLDPSVLSAASSGGVVATVKVERAENLPASDAWGTSDPYFLAVLDGGAAHQSQVQNRTCSPTFDDEFDLYVSRPPSKPESSADPLDATLKISLFDSDALTADDALGSAEVTLRELSEKGGDVVELKLSAPNGRESSPSAAASASSGSVFVSATVRTLSTAEVEERSSGKLAPDGSSEVARMSRAWRSLAKAAAAAASAASAKSPPTNGGGCSGDDDETIFRPVAFVENPASDTQLWVGVDAPERRIVVAFRGTETTKILDVLTDLNASWAPLDARALDGEPGALPIPRYARVERRAAAEGGPPLVLDRDNLWCHQGFLAAYRSVRCSVLRVLGEVLSSEAEKRKERGASSSAEPWTILFTGHSLGGALSTLCSYECAHLKFTDAERLGGVERLVVYNYGSPRVGSAAFAGHFDSSVADAWRIFNAADLVPRIPRLLGYAHVGCAVPLKADGTFDDGAIAENYAAGMYGDGDYVPVEDPSAPASASPSASRSPSPRSSMASTSSGEPAKIFDEEGANPLIAAKALASAAASALFGANKRKNEGGAEGDQEVSSSEKQAAADAVSKLISSEIKTMNDFLSGDAVSHHTESVYLEVLKKAVDAASDLARELEEESRGENVEGEVEAAAQKAAAAAAAVIEEAKKA